MRKFYEEQYRKEDSTAEAVVALGYVDYTDHPAVREYERHGYALHDAVVFGRGEQWGEVLIFTKRPSRLSANKMQDNR